MSPLHVDLGERSYPIHFTDDEPGEVVVGCLEALKAGLPKRALIVTDTNVGPLYLAPLRDQIEARGVQIEVYEVPAGEASKCFAVLEGGLNAALEAGLSRSDVVIALGGGVVGDLAGLLASLIHRGVDLIQVPTSLLAQVDSSVGGKTAINHTLGKNLIGAFWQPKAVVISSKTLETLDRRHLRSGLSEALKHGLIASPPLLEELHQHAATLRSGATEGMLSIVRACCTIKASIVAQDERDTGVRAILNFGHTLGHGFETGGGLTHGEAVALGMVLAGRLSEELGVAEPGTAAEIEARVKELGLPHDPYAEGVSDLEEVLRVARVDKKGDGSEISFILLRKLGVPLIRRLNWRHIREALASCKTSLDTEETR